MWQDGQDPESAIAAVVDFFERRGRMPMIEETPEALLPLLRSVTARRLAALAAQAANPIRVAEGQKNTILNVLLLLGMEIFDGRSPLQSLPIPIQADIRAFFESYPESCRRATGFYLSSATTRTFARKCATASAR